MSKLNFKSKSPLITMPRKEQKNFDNSLEIQDQKILINQDRQLKTIKNYQDENAMNTKMINFRRLKETVPKKQVKRKGQIKIGKINNENYQKVNKYQLEPSHQISINVNIQNMMPKANEGPKNDLSMITGQDILKPKKPLIKHMKRIQDFQCNQEIHFKLDQYEKKHKFGERNLDKPLIEKKNVRQDYGKMKNNVFEQKQQIKKLQMESTMINLIQQAEAMIQLDQRQQYYVVPANYIQKYQKNFTWMMRVILIEWMLHVCYEFSLKRQTFHIAVNLVDLYMCKEHNLQKSQFQLAGAAAMFIASKLEEFEPKCSEDFAKTTKGRYTAKQIKIMQLKICSALKYRLNPPTVYMWANRFMLQWDDYVANNLSSPQKHYLFATCQPCFFKKADKFSVRLFRQLMQYIDCATLHIHTVQYKPKLLVCSFMYLVLSLEMSIFKKQDVVNKFPDTSQYLLDVQNPFNDFFMNFLQESLGIILIDLLPTIQYAASFFLLVLTYEEPIVPQNQNGQNSQNFDQIVNLEEYCSYQTHNQNMTLAIKNRNKNLR